jgi:hypothetical protein
MSNPAVRLTLSTFAARRVVEILNSYVEMCGGPDPERDLVTLADELAGRMTAGIELQETS